MRELILRTSSDCGQRAECQAAENVEGGAVVVAPVDMAVLSSPLVSHYRCPDDLPPFVSAHGDASPAPGFFRFGPDVVCYGEATEPTASSFGAGLRDLEPFAHGNQRGVELPFDPTAVIENLRYERYLDGLNGARWIEASFIRDTYYRLRPVLPSWIRKGMQRLYLRGWQDLAFPQWPVDRTVDRLFERLMVLTIRTLETDRLPFIWFWPEGRSACAVVTHDVETEAGRDFTGRLLDMNEQFDIRSALQIVPERRYEVPEEYLEMIRERGCETNVHGLNHLGNLFEERDSFLAAAVRINSYGEAFQSRGFRSPSLYRNVEWFRELNFSYDMTFPNVARLEPQRGGCCTVFPYFLPGGMLELPLTTAEDYTLFHILKQYSCDIWKAQIQAIAEGHGLISILAHPDYVRADRAMSVYQELLSHLARLRSDEKVWVTIPGEVDSWWRQRAAMSLVHDDGENQWRIEGRGSERAVVAFARIENSRLVYDIPRLHSCA